MVRRFVVSQIPFRPADALPGDRLYIGTAAGAVQVYSFLLSEDSEGLPKVTWIKTHNLSRRQIDQIGVLPHSGHLLIISGQFVHQALPMGIRLISRCHGLCIYAE